MTEKSAIDPADDAEDLSYRYAHDLEIAVAQIMLNLGLPDHQMGARDPERGLEHHTFWPHERTGGSIDDAGRVVVDSGVMNPELLAGAYDKQAQEAWKHTRLGPRIEAVIAHELTEYECGGNHERALITGPKTELPISHAARELLRRMESGWVGGGTPPQ